MLKVFLKNLKIRTKILSSLVISIIIMSNILVYTSTLISKQIIYRYLYEHLHITQQEMGNGIALLLDEVSMLSVRLLTHTEIYNVLADSTISKSEKESAFRKILDNMLFNREIIGDIMISTHEDELYSYMGEGAAIQKPDNLFIRQIEESNQIMVWGPVRKDIDGQAYLVIGKKFRNFFTSQKQGYLMIYIREQAILDIYRDLISDIGYSYIIADENYIISHPSNEKTGSTFFESDFQNMSNKYEYIRRRDQKESTILVATLLDDQLKRFNCNWKVVSVISEERLFGIIQKINRYVFIVEILILLITIYLAIRVSTTISKPIKRLQDKLRKFKNEHSIHKILSGQAGDEIWELEDTYNKMVVRINELIETNNKEKEKQRKLELIALQAQINPHFLYNTLDAIGWIAKIKKQQDIEKLVLALARFFRISLHKGDKLITIREEMELVKNYAIIELIRFPDKFDLEFDIDEEIADYPILKLTIQPIFENAVKHGISLKNDKGHIMIRGRKRGEHIYLEVIDDGVGFDQKKFFSKKSEKHNEGGYGLANVDERVKLEYGLGCGIKVRSNEKGGTTVTIKIKAQPQTEE